MKKWGTIAAVFAFAIFAVADLIHDFVTNDPIGYFSTEPHQLFYVAAIAIIGGLAALGFDWLSPRTQRRVRVFVWGAAASTLTAIAGYFAFCFFSISSFIAESTSTFGVLFVPLIFAGIAAYLWFKFYRALKAGLSR